MLLVMVMFSGNKKWVDWQTPPGPYRKKPDGQEHERGHNVQCVRSTAVSRHLNLLSK